MNLCWFDIQIEDRIATLRANFFVGINAGGNVYKIGFLCLIGIAHLPENLAKLKFSKSFELRPCITTDLCEMISEELETIPRKAQPILGNLFHSIKLICSKVLPVMQVSGNVKIQDDDVFMKQQIDKQSYVDEISHKIPDDLDSNNYGHINSLRRQRDKSEPYSKSYADFPIARHLQVSQKSLATQLTPIGERPKLANTNF